MGMVKVEDLKPGMTLATPVCDRRYHMILREGSVLTENHIQFLIRWKIDAVDIQGVEEVPLAEIEARVASDVAAQAKLREIEDRFAGVTNDILLEVRDLVKRRFLKKVVQG